MMVGELSGLSVGELNRLRDSVDTELRKRSAGIQFVYGDLFGPVSLDYVTTVTRVTFSSVLLKSMLDDAGVKVLDDVNCGVNAIGPLGRPFRCEVIDLMLFSDHRDLVDWLQRYRGCLYFAFKRFVGGLLECVVISDTVKEFDGE